MMSWPKRAFGLILIMVFIIIVVASRFPAADNKKRRASQPKITKVRMEVVAYCPCEKCCGKWAKVPLARRKTASGRSLKELIDKGILFCAADKSVPFGTIFEVPGYGRAIVEDRGGAIKVNMGRAG